MSSFRLALSSIRPAIYEFNAWFFNNQFVFNQSTELALVTKPSSTSFNDE
jgi:hypothetical protein